MPGIVANCVLNLMTAANTVVNRLWLWESFEITNTGLRFARGDRTGAPRSAQKTPPLRRFRQVVTARCGHNRLRAVRLCPIGGRFVQ